MRKSLLLSLSFVSGLFASETSAPMEHQAQVEQTSSCVSHDHSGFYIGAAVGASNVQIKIKENFGSLVTEEISPSFENKKKTGFAGGINLGYGWQFGNFYFAPEYEFLMHTTKNELKASLKDLDATIRGTSYTGINGSVSANVKYKWSMSLSGKFGYVFGSTIAYLKLGIASCQSSVSGSATDIKGTTGGSEVVIPGTADNLKEITNSSIKSTHFGPVFGAGIEHAICKNIYLTGDLSYTMYNKSTKFNNLKVNFLTGLVGLKFKI